MNLLPFGNLPPFARRRFVPENARLDTWTKIVPFFDQLEKRLKKISSERKFQHWVQDWGELTAVLDEEGSRRYIAMTCHTDSVEAKEAYLYFIEKIEPEIKPRHFKLEKLYLAHPRREQLPDKRYRMFNRYTEAHVALFRKENVPLETKENKLGQQYQELSGSLTVKFNGKEQTLVQMGRYLEEPDRELRRKAWELVTERRLKEAEKFDDIFDQQLQLRTKLARNAGCKDYLEYAFRKLARFDYTPNDCLDFHLAIENEVVPLLKELQAERKKKLKLPALKPWDLAVDPENQPPLRPFDKVEQMVQKTQTIFDQLDGHLAQGFRQMQDLKLLDLDNRKGKAPGGYQSTLSDARLPFIFMNAVGQQRDVETILHEAGHAFHTLATQKEPIYANRTAPIEFCEVASMSMELLGADYLDVFYSPAEARRARREHLEGIVEVFPWIATVDAFQHWVYTHPKHTRQDRIKAWTLMMDRFGGDVDWKDYEKARSLLWHRQLHIFLHPFYYVEYGIAQLGALQVWANSREDKKRALENYQVALSLGGTKPLPQLFEAAGCHFSFGRRSIKPLIQLVRDELQRLG
jgi:oligoendopeptidase F